MNFDDRNEGSRPRLGRPRDWIIGGALFAAIVLGVSLTVGWGPLLAPWATFSLPSLLPLLGLSALSYLLRAVRIYDYFSPRLDGRFLAVLRLSVLHNVANSLLPMRAGEMVFPWLMWRYFGHGVLESTVSIVWIRLFDLHFLGVVGIFVCYLRQPSWLWTLAGLAWMSLLLLMGRARRLHPQGAGRVARGLRLVTQAAPISASRGLRTYAWTALSWSSKLFALAVVLRHFVPVDLWRVLIGVIGAELSSVLPVYGIAGTGTYEVAVVAGLVPFGVSAERALAGAVNLHLFLLGVVLLIGLLALMLPVRRAPAKASAPAPGAELPARPVAWRKGEGE